MKKLLLLASLAVAGSAPAFGQVNVLVAGWDFEFSPAANYAGLTPQGVLAANYSDLYEGANGLNNPVNDGPPSASRGTLYLNGTNGSDLWTFTGPTSSVQKNTSFSDADFQILTRDGSSTKLGGFGGLDTAALGLNRTTATRSEISFVLNTVGLASLDDVVYRTRLQADGITPSIDWSLVVGANTFALGGPISVLGTVYSTQSFDLSTIDLAGAPSVTLIGTIANPSTSNIVLIDNLGVYGITGGLVIPEPTTYAAILGALTLGIVGLRRRNAMKIA